jgi:hypothetical protein
VSIEQRHTKRHAGGSFFKDTSIIWTAGSKWWCLGWGVREVGLRVREGGEDTFERLGESHVFHLTAV